MTLGRENLPQDLRSARRGSLEGTKCRSPQLERLTPQAAGTQF